MRSQGVGQAVDVMRVAGFPRDGFVLCGRKHAVRGFTDGHVEHGLLSLDRWGVGPQLVPTLPTPVTDVQGHHLAGLGIHGDPDPWLVGLLPHAAPHLIGFAAKPVNHEVVC